MTSTIRAKANSSVKKALKQIGYPVVVSAVTFWSFLSSNQCVFIPFAMIGLSVCVMGASNYITAFFFYRDPYPISDSNVCSVVSIFEQTVNLLELITRWSITKTFFMHLNDLFRFFMRYQGLPLEERCESMLSTCLESYKAFIEGFSSIIHCTGSHTLSPGKWMVVTMIRIDYKCTEREKKSVWYVIRLSNLVFTIRIWSRKKPIQDII